MFLVPRLGNGLWGRGGIVVKFYTLLKRSIEPGGLEAIEGFLPAHLAREMNGAMKIPALYLISSDKQIDML